MLQTLKCISGMVFYHVIVKYQHTPIDVVFQDFFVFHWTALGPAGPYSVV